MTSAPRVAWGHGLATLTSAGEVLDTWYPEPRLGAPDGSPSATLDALVVSDPARGVRRELVTTEIDRLLPQTL